MSVNGLNASMTGLQVNQFRLDVGANNVANVNTGGFRSSTVTTSDLAYINSIGTGTQVTGTYAPDRPGPMGFAPTGADANRQALATPNQGLPTPPVGGPVANNAGTQSNLVELSNTDMVVEITNMMNSQNAYNANITMGRTQQEVTQTLMDLRA